MNDRTRDFIQRVTRTKVGLDVALFYQGNPNTFDTPSGIALRTHRGVAEVKPALERLASHGILETHERADGKYTCYALVRDPEIWSLLCMVSEAYHDDPEMRKEIVRMLVAQRQEDRLQDDPRNAAGREQTDR